MLTLDKYLLYFYKRSQLKNIKLEEYIDKIFSQIAQKIKTQGDFYINLEDKIELSKYIIKQAFERFPVKHLAIAWTGGKDSTLLLWLIKETTRELNKPFPTVLFINEGDVFEEILDFRNELIEKWKLNVIEVKNEDVLSKVKKIGDKIPVEKLNKRNQEELKRVGFNEKHFIFEPESLEGNHLMKTVALNMALEKYGYKGLFTGIRWDEQGARQNEAYFSPRGDEFVPYHTRIHPLLHIKEKEVWEITLKYKIPYCKLYEKGYRSLGAKSTTKAPDKKAAWEQDFEKIPERAGRKQDKEKMMERLRKLGYM